MKPLGLLVLLVLGVSFTIAPRDGASQVRVMGLDDLVRESTCIVRARVIDRSVYWTENSLGEMIVSDFHLEVSDVLKGQVAENAVLQCFGGQVDELTMTASEPTHSSSHAGR